MAGPQKRKRRALKVLAQKAAQAQKKVVAPTLMRLNHFMNLMKKYKLKD